MVSKTNKNNSTKKEKKQYHVQGVVGGVESEVVYKNMKTVQNLKKGLILSKPWQRQWQQQARNRAWRY